MLLRNDLSAIDYLNENEFQFDNLGLLGMKKKIKQKIDDLKYKEALNELEKITSSLAKN